MKALSLKQPVPELILQGKKTIELRTWNTHFRGPFYLHASNTFFDAWLERFTFEKEKLLRGTIVGTAELTNVKTYTTLAAFQNDAPKHLGVTPKKLPTYGYLLENPQRLEHPFPFKGKLNFFEVPL